MPETKTDTRQHQADSKYLQSIARELRQLSELKDPIGNARARATALLRVAIEHGAFAGPDYAGFRVELECFGWQNPHLFHEAAYILQGRPDKGCFDLLDVCRYLAGRIDAEAARQTASASGVTPTARNCKPSEEIAFNTYNAACSMAGRDLTDEEAYQLARDHAAGDDGLPSFDTWARQLRAGRRAHQ